MAAKPEVRKRQSTTKTKTGCLTCKVRRVKCDEGKPECNRCLKTGRKCDGYALNGSESSRAVTLRSTPTQITGSSQEKRAFQYFLVQTAAELSGSFSGSFWERLILQASASNPALRHAVIAIGTIHEEFKGNRLSYYDGGNSEGLTFATNQHTKAISHLRKSLATGKQSPVTALMSCILFICFDSLRGYFESAMLHLQSGLKILGELKGQSKEDVSIIEDEIVPIFLRLSVQAILYLDTRSILEKREFVAKLSTLSTKETRKIDSFKTLEEARLSLNRAADGFFRWLYIVDPDLPMPHQLDGICAQYLEQLEQIASWHNAFEKFMAAKSKTMNGRQVRGAALLKIQHCVANMMAQSIPPLDSLQKLGDATNDPEYFASKTNEFRIIFNLARSLIVAAEQDAKTGQPPLTFSTDLGVIGPLYYLCGRCQDLSLKRAALGLLTRCPRKEGMWDSETTVRIVQEYWAIEEKHNQRSLAYANETGLRIPLAEVVELEINDGMKWDWKWKDPFSGAPSPSYPLDVDFIGGTQDYGMFPVDFMLFGSSSEFDGSLEGLTPSSLGLE